MRESNSHNVLTWIRTHRLPAPFPTTRLQNTIILILIPTIIWNATRTCVRSFSRTTVILFSQFSFHTERRQQLDLPFRTPRTLKWLNKHRIIFRAYHGPWVFVALVFFFTLTYSSHQLTLVSHTFRSKYVETVLKILQCTLDGTTVQQFTLTLMNGTVNKVA